MKSGFIKAVVIIIVSTASLFAQNTVMKRTHWIDMGQDESGIQMFLSFNFFEEEMYIQTPDTVKRVTSKKYSTRCRYKLSNMTDHIIVVTKVAIKASENDVYEDVYSSKKKILIKPWENYFGAFMTPKLRNSEKTANKVYMKISAHKK